MTKEQIEYIKNNLNLGFQQIKNTIDLLSNGATVPFIARYRKDQTSNLDEVDISKISEEYKNQLEVEKRKEFILKSIEEQNKLTPDLKAKIENSYSLIELEDYYAPYKKKRKTKATIAIEKGLEPLALIVFSQKENNISEIAKKYINEEIKDVDEALQGANDIIAEWISEDVNAKNKLRKLFKNKAIISSEVKKDKEKEAENFEDYFEYEEELKNIPSHRLLAIRRGENLGFLKVKIWVDPEEAIEILERYFLQGMPEPKKQVKIAIEDSYKRLIKASLDNEFSAISKEKADLEAIGIFRTNLRQLLLFSPLGQKRVLSFDPGFKTGCKVAILDQTGNLKDHGVVFLHQAQDFKSKVLNWISKYDIEAIAVGNGTASRESNDLVKETLAEAKLKIPIYMVSEQGASIYSASEVAREEFPNLDLTYRGAVSIGRRLMDPLSELVKIDPKSIGVGQYQHDVDHTLLVNSLNQEVESTVNKVGVELNSASKNLLAYVAGIGPIIAKNIVDYRNKNGKFKSRKELLEVPRLGPKVFEQAAGFLRISDAKFPLDNTAIHPESYSIVERMAGNNLEEFINDKERRKAINTKSFIAEGVGEFTLKDILEELNKPNRDLRGTLEEFEFSAVHKIDDLHEGMVVNGIVTNITAFGCFVDIGVHQDGLIHISKMAKKFISDPNEVVKVGQSLKVKIIEVQKERKRISLSLIDF